MSNAALLKALNDAIAAGDEERIHDAAVAAGDAGNKRAIPVLLSLLRDDPRVRVKTGGAIALRELRATVAVPELIKLIESPEFRRNRGTFVYALQTLDWYAKYPHAVARLVVDPNYEVRSMAVGALELAADQMSRAQKGNVLVALSLGVLARIREGPLTEDEAEAAGFASQLLATKKMLRDTQFELVLA